MPGSGTTPAKPSREKIDSKKMQKPRQSRQRSDSQVGKDRSRRSMSRGKSPSPMPWSLLKEVDEKRSSRQSTPSLLNKLDARTVTVRKSWSRSQSIGPINVQSAIPPSTDTSKNNSVMSRRYSIQPEASSMRQTRPVSTQCESQTLVMATPSKGQSSRSSSFSLHHQIKPRMSMSTARSDTMAAWRRTESQPVLSSGIKKEMGRYSDEEENDYAAEEQVVDSLFYDDSEDEENHDPDHLRVPTHTYQPPLHRLEEIPPKCQFTVKRPALPDEEDDTESIIVKKRRTLPSNFSFALQDASDIINTSRNPFAVSNKIA